MNSKLRTLITGAAGFIGSGFVRLLLTEESQQILAIDKLTYASNRNALPADDWSPSRFQFLPIDLLDREALVRAVQDFRPHQVVHFAAESHVDRSIENPLDCVATNVNGTCNLLLALDAYWRTMEAEARSRFRFLHVSTDEVFGSLGDTGKFKETSRYDPRSPYAASKAAGDHFVRAWHHTYGLPMMVSHCSNNFGPYQHVEKLIPRMICNAIQGTPLPVYGDGQHVRDWLFVDDHCRALQLLLQEGTIGESYNIGGNCEKKNVDVVNQICDTVQWQLPQLPHACKELVTYVQDRAGHDRRYAMDTSKIERELGWQPTTSFEEGLRVTVAWYIDALGVKKGARPS